MILNVDSWPVDENQLSFDWVKPALAFPYR